MTRSKQNSTKQDLDSNSADNYNSQKLDSVTDIGANKTRETKHTRTAIRCCFSVCSRLIIMPAVIEI
ncbi:hypothetical protein ACET3Z_003887 [Daucus carota]